MAAGDLSADQRRYLTALVAATGLDRTAATAWIGAESGWSRTKSDHNYLNIGPGRRYSSATAGAARAATIINDDDRYDGIREAIATGDGGAQVVAIAASPWDAGHYGGDGSRLTNVYKQLAGTDDGTSLVQRFSWLAGPLAGALANQGSDAVEGVTGAVQDAAGFLANPAAAVTSILTGEPLRDVIVRWTLTVGLLAVAGALVVIGLLRMTRIDNDAASAAVNLGGLIATRGASAAA